MRLTTTMAESLLSKFMKQESNNFQQKTSRQPFKEKKKKLSYYEKEEQVCRYSWSRFSCINEGSKLQYL